MRSAIAVCVFALACASASAQSNNVQAVDHYRRFAYLPTLELDRCSSLLAGELSTNEQTETLDARLLRADDRLKKENCLDNWSSLVSNSVTASASAESASQSAMKVIVESDALYLFIPFFSDADKASRHLWSSIKALPRGWHTRVREVFVDLQDNEGGSVDDLADVLNQYFAPAAGAEYMKIRATDYPAKHIATRRGVLAGYPITVLTNERTASASEWLIEELESWYPQTRIVGKKTYGKAVIQCFRQEGGIRMKLTCGRWDSDVRPVHGVGINPDVILDLTTCGSDAKCLIGMARTPKS